MMLCTPYSLKTDSYADIGRRDVVNAPIMHKESLNNELIFYYEIGACLGCIYFLRGRQIFT